MLIARGVVSAPEYRSVVDPLDAIPIPKYVAVLVPPVHVAKLIGLTLSTLPADTLH